MEQGVTFGVTPGTYLNCTSLAHSSYTALLLGFDSVSKAVCILAKASASPPLSGWCLRAHSLYACIKIMYWSGACSWRLKDNQMNSETPRLLIYLLDGFIIRAFAKAQGLVMRQAIEICNLHCWNIASKHPQSDRLELLRYFCGQRTTHVVPIVSDFSAGHDPRRT